MVQVLGDAPAGATLAAVLGHPLADVRNHARPPVPQGDVPLHVAFQKYAAAPLQAQPRRQAAVVVGARRVLRIDLYAADPLYDAVAHQHAGPDRRALVRADLRDHEAEVRPECAVQPAVVLQRLPVAGPPGVVAQPQAIDLHALAVDGERPLHPHVLLVVGARELPLRVHRLALEAGRPEHRADAFVDELQAYTSVRVLAERLSRVRHLLRLGEEHRRALLGRAMPAHP